MTTITLDSEQLYREISSAITDAVAQAARSYDVQQRIRSGLAESLASTSVAQCVNEAVQTLDWHNLTAHLATELTHALRRGITLLVTDAVAGVIASIRAGDGFLSTTERAELTRSIGEELRAGPR